MVPPKESDIIDLMPDVELPGRMTEEDFVRWVPEDVSAECVNGDVIVLPWVRLQHTQISHWFQIVLGLYIRDRKLGEFLGPRLMVRLQHTGTSRRIPDLLFVSNAKAMNLQKNHLEGPPDLIIEVVSPESIARDWREKFIEYEAAGVAEYWIVDPLTGTLEASIRSPEGKFVKVDVDADGVLRSTTVPGFWMKPEWLWQEELPNPIDHLRTLGVI